MSRDTDDEYRRQQIIEEAVRAADRIIMDGSDGSVEEADWLTSAVALQFAEKVHSADTGRLMRVWVKKIMRDSS